MLSLHVSELQSPRIRRESHLWMPVFRTVILELCGKNGCVPCSVINIFRALSLVTFILINNLISTTVTYHFLFSGSGERARRARDELELCIHCRNPTLNLLSLTCTSASLAGITILFVASPSSKTPKSLFVEF